MKSRLTRSLPLFVLSLFLFTFVSSAASLSLTKIGALDTTGKTYTEWWYTQANPNLVGTADASSTVSVKIGDTTSTATPNAAGDWSLATTMAIGDHAIVISQGDASYSFTLHITQTLPTTFTSTTQTSQSSTTVPDTGSDQLVALGLALGLTLFATYLYISGDTSKKTVFERQFIKD